MKLQEPYQLVGTAVCDPLDEYKKKVASIINEYFTTSDVDFAATELRELGSFEYHPSLRGLYPWLWIGMTRRRK